MRSMLGYKAAVSAACAGAVIGASAAPADAFQHALPPKGERVYSVINLAPAESDFGFLNQRGHAAYNYNYGGGIGYFDGQRVYSPGPFNDGYKRVTALNEQGVVVVDTDYGEGSAYSWTVAGGARLLTGFGFARGINERSQIAGVAERRARVWNPMAARSIWGRQLRIPKPMTSTTVAWPQGNTAALRWPGPRQASRSRSG